MGVLTTSFLQFKAFLNSQPLYQLLDDPSDPALFTPGYFLIDALLNALTDPSLLEVKINHFSREKMVRRMLQSFLAR